MAPYLWGPRTKTTIDVGQLSRSTTIDFENVVPQLHMAFAAHFEASVQRWTAFGDLFYMSIGESETQNGISTSVNLQQLFFEFGAMYRLGPVSLGRAGRLTFEPLAGARLMWVDASLGFPNQKVSDNAAVVDPMIGGRIAYHITDTVALWFRETWQASASAASHLQPHRGARMALPPPRLRPGRLAVHEHRPREGQRVERLQFGRRDERTLPRGQLPLLRGRLSD